MNTAITLVPVNSGVRLGLLLMTNISQDDPFFNPKRRLQSAENKISDLDAAIWAYRHEHPPDLIFEADEPDRHTKTYKFKFTAPFPDEWVDLPMEILEATRSALDQCAYAAAKLSGNTRLKATQFPIGDSLDGLNHLITGRKVCQDVPDTIVAVFVRFKPYKGGNDDLWALNKLRNSTHARLLPIAVRGANIHIRHSARSTGELTPLNPVFDSAKRELPFARAPIDDQFAFGAYPTFNIGFEEANITGRRHAIAFLTTVVNEVHEIVEATETACVQLGFI
jgi:hypothetical protein